MYSTTAILLTFLIANLLLSLISSEGGRCDETRLIADRLSNYGSTSARPVTSVQRVVSVRLGASLLQIIEINESKQILEAKFWFELKWKDGRLAWDPSTYGGCTDIRLPTAKIWIPDIVLYNSLDEKPFSLKADADAAVISEGNVSYVVPMIAKSFCRLDVRHYPFDEQVCSLKFGSWTYDGSKLDLWPMLDQVDLSTYSSNSAWMLTNAAVTRNVLHYMAADAPFIDLTFTVSVARIIGLQQIFMIFIITILLVLGILVFCLSAERGERVALNIILILTTIAYQLHITEKLPETFQIPVVVKCCYIIIFLLTYSTIVAIVLKKLQMCAGKDCRIPALIRIWVVEKLGCVFGIGCCGKCKNKNTEDAENKHDENKEQTTKMAEWRRLILVLDRLFFIIFFILLIIFFCLI